MSSPLVEISRVLVRLDYVASYIANPIHGIMHGKFFVVYADEKLTFVQLE